MAIIYIAFLLIAIAASSRIAPVQAVSLVYLAGIIFLPVSPPLENPPSLESAGDSPYWIMPFALPANVFFTKALVASLAALVVAFVFDRRTLFAFRPHWVDLPMLGWCIWPLVQSVWTDASPAGWQSGLYLACVWGIPWILARIYLSGRKGQLAFIDGFVALTLVLLPVILFETFSEIRIHELVYGPHAFADVGTERYFGYRPLAFFEDGNQYGLWIACAALLAVWRAKFARHGNGNGGKLRMAAAILLFDVAIASQSAGALVLLFAGLTILLFAPVLRILRKAMIPAVMLFGAVMAVYLSGALPLRAIAKETTAGQMVWSALQASGRGSLSWRIGQDQKTLPAIKENIVAGSGQWDWWRELGRRPWGLALLLIGQFGLIGLALIAVTVLRSFWVQFLNPDPDRDSTSQGNPQLVLAIVVLIAMLDALLNAFLIMPMVMAAAAASFPRSGRKPD